MRMKKKQSKKPRSRSVSHSVFVALPDNLSNLLIADLVEIERSLKSGIFEVKSSEFKNEIRKESKRCH